MIEHSGGRAGVHEYGWVLADYNLNDIESLRQELLRQNDIGQIQKAMQKLGIRIRRDLLQIIKSYLFDSRGLGFLYSNYAAWRRLATGQGMIGDASYLIHEIAEVQQLQRIQSQTGFDFMGRKEDNKKSLSRREAQQWEADFDRYYKEAHSKALEAEYEFITQKILDVTNGQVNISIYQAASIDPTRRIRPGAEDTEGARYMLVGGAVLKEHHHFSAWRKRADELVPLSKAAQRRLRYYRPKIALEVLIRYIKNIRIN